MEDNRDGVASSEIRRMKNKPKLTLRLKRYFTEKPSSNFWMWAFIYLFIFNYLTPMIVYFSLFLMVGLAVPEADLTEATEIASEGLTNVFIFTVTTFFEIGKNIAIDHPILSKILMFAIAHIIWIVYFGMFIMVLHLLRYFISWIIRKRNNYLKFKHRK